MTNGVTLARFGMWACLIRDKEEVWPTWFLPSSSLAWLASRSELIEASCSTSWAFSSFVSCSWELRASTWAERSLASVSNLPICTWFSVGPTRYRRIKTPSFYILIFFLLGPGGHFLIPESALLSCRVLSRAACKLEFLLCVALSSSLTSSSRFCEACSLSEWLICDQNGWAGQASELHWTAESIQDKWNDPYPHLNFLFCWFVLNGVSCRCTDEYAHLTTFSIIFQLHLTKRPMHPTFTVVQC